METKTKQDVKQQGSALHPVLFLFILIFEIKKYITV